MELELHPTLSHLRTTAYCRELCICDCIVWLFWRHSKSFSAVFCYTIHIQLLISSTSSVYFVMIQQSHSCALFANHKPNQTKECMCNNVRELNPGDLACLRQITIICIHFPKHTEFSNFLKWYVQVIQTHYNLVIHHQNMLPFITHGYNFT